MLPGKKDAAASASIKKTPSQNRQTESTFRSYNACDSAMTNGKVLTVMSSGSRVRIQW